jgi:phage terminase Nu1 subunit (DNA packaging protein)
VWSRSLDLRVFSVSDIAVLTGQNRSTIAKHIREGCPVVKAGSRGRGEAYEIDLPRYIRWMIDRAVRAATEGSGEEKSESSRRRMLNAQASLAELNLSKAYGEVVSIEDVMEHFETNIAEVRQRLLAIEPKAPLVRAAKTDALAQDVLGKFIRDALDGFTEYRPARPELEAAFAHGGSDPEEVEGSAEADD